MESEAQGKVRLAAVLGGAALTALLLVLAAGTGAGPGIGPDGVVYIDAARQFADGHGPQATDAHGNLRLVTTWPPLFPALLGFGALLGLEPATAALLLNAWSHAALALLVGLLAWRLGGRVTGAAIAGWLMATAPIALLYAGRVLTEPLFMVLATGALLFALAHYRDGHLRHLVWAGLLVGLACMQRYAGYAWLAALPLWLLLRPGRLRNTGVFLAAALPMPLAWRAVMWVSDSALDPRAASFGWPTSLHVKSLAHSLSTWLLPESSPVALRAVAAGLVLMAAAAGVAWVVRRISEPATAPALLLLLVAVCYGLVLGSTVLFLDRALLPEPRMLLPLLPFSLAALGWALSGLQGRARWAGFGLAALIGLAGLIRDVEVAGTLRAGDGYAAPVYRDSPTLRAALEQPGLLYASNPQPLILYGAIPARALPLDGTIEYLMPLGNSPWPDTAVARRELREKLAQAGCVVWFKRDGPVDELKAELGLVTLAAYEDGELLVRR